MKTFLLWLALILGALAVGIIGYAWLKAGRQEELINLAVGFGTLALISVTGAYALLTRDLANSSKAATLHAATAARAAERSARVAEQSLMYDSMPKVVVGEPDYKDRIDGFRRYWFFATNRGGSTAYSVEGVIDRKTSEGTELFSDIGPFDLEPGEKVQVPPEDREQGLVPVEQIVWLQWETNIMWNDMFGRRFRSQRFLSSDGRLTNTSISQLNIETDAWEAFPSGFESH